MMAMTLNFENLSTQIGNVLYLGIVCELLTIKKMVLFRIFIDEILRRAHSGIDFQREEERETKIESDSNRLETFLASMNSQMLITPFDSLIIRIHFLLLIFSVWLHCYKNHLLHTFICAHKVFSFACVRDVFFLYFDFTILLLNLISSGKKTGVVKGAFSTRLSCSFFHPSLSLFLFLQIIFYVILIARVDTHSPN